MRDAKLFRVSQGHIEALPSSSVALEKSLQTLIERHLDTLLGVRFLASEHPTVTAHGGRIDTLGLDENNCPVIIEYKRALNENVINQGLFYLDWLMNHKADFKWLVLENYGKEIADAIDWSAPRLICIAGEFTKYDEYAVRQIPQRIELVRYRRYGEDLLLLDVVASTPGEHASSPKAVTVKSAGTNGDDVIPAGKPYVLQLLEKCSPLVQDRFEALRAYVLALGDVQERTVKEYITYRRLKAFANVQFSPLKDCILVYVNGSLDSISAQPGFAQNTGWGAGVWRLKLTIDSDDDLELAKPLILKSYEAS